MLFFSKSKQRVDIVTWTKRASKKLDFLLPLSLMEPSARDHRSRVFVPLSLRVLWCLPAVTNGWARLNCIVCLGSFDALAAGNCQGAHNGDEGSLS